jgi:hypothetical protein
MLNTTKLAAPTMEANMANGTMEGSLVMDGTP